MTREDRFVLFFDDLCNLEDGWCGDIDGGTFQELATKHGLFVLEPARTQDERDEWGDDATLYYPSKDAVEAVVDARARQGEKP